MFFRDIGGFAAIAGLPALFLVGWIACWIILHRAPLWAFGVASWLSAASIFLAWVVSATGAGAGEEHKAVAFYGLLLNGVTGLLWVGVLAIATAIIELIRMVLHGRSPDTSAEKAAVSKVQQS